MTRAFFGILLLSKNILYSIYESRHKRQHESHMRTYSWPSHISISYSSVMTAKSTFSGMSSEGQLEVVQGCLERSSGLVSSRWIRRLDELVVTWHHDLMDRI